MARRKVILLVVEGLSDEEALSLLFSRIFDRNVIKVLVMHTDITSKKGVDVFNIVKILADEIKTYMKSQYLRKDDFDGIIHIVDTDGTYIANKFVFEDLSLNSVIYETTGIRTKNKREIEERNRQKSLNLDKINSIGTIMNIPYNVYYMSCNLDHVLYDKLNTTKQEKEQDSLNFLKKYENRKEEFITYISNSSFSRIENYEKSWEYIKKELHSLERNTNLGLCFKNKI